MELSGKTAFVSGSSGGIGYAVASALSAEGVDVVVNGRDSARVDAAVARLQREHADRRPSGLVADFSEPADVQRLLEALGSVDILVNNVGLFDLAPFELITDEVWDRYLAVNVMSGVRMSRHLLPGMLDRGWGRIIFISSESGVNVPADMVHYGVTKAAVLALANGLAKRTRGTAVTINSVLGGPTYSDGVAATVEALAQEHGVPAETFKASVIGQNTTTLLNRFLDPAEIAHLVTYLASPLASATNGAAVRADGGTLTGVL